MKENHTAMKCASTDRTRESIWHRRYGHLGARNLERILKEQLVDGFDYEPKKESSFCEPCVDGKRSTWPFPKTGGERSDELLGVVHSDVCRKTEAKSLSGTEYFVTFRKTEATSLIGTEYFVTFIDDKSSFVWVYPLKHKSEAFEKLEINGGKIH